MKQTKKTYKILENSKVYRKIQRNIDSSREIYIQKQMRKYKKIQKQIRKSRNNVEQYRNI